MKNSKKPRRLADSTIAIHAGEGKFQKNEPVGTVIARTASFTFSSSEEMRLWAEGKSSAYMYTRYANPTLAVAEEKIARLEGGEAALVTASGMAAISSALLSVLKAGDEVIVTQALYGGSYRLLRDIFPRMGIVVRHVDTDLAGIERLVNPRTKALYVETPTNPSLRLVDMRKAAAFAKEWDLISLIDNTFASPVLQKPLEIGFDLVMHSATKYDRRNDCGTQQLDQGRPRNGDLSRRFDGSGSGVSADSRDENAGSADEKAMRECDDRR
jgi:methionine-gamma-lyase